MRYDTEIIATPLSLPVSVYLDVASRLHMLDNMMITVGTMRVKFSLRRDENLFQDSHSGGWIAEYKDLDGRWTKLGTYNSQESAAKALYIERL